MKQVQIAPSLLAADFGSFAEAAKSCEAAGAERLHFDIMDGHFVPNISFGPQVLRALRPHSAATFEAHLMIANPEQYIEEFAAAGAQLITVHAEATVHVQRALHQIRQAGAKAGLALNPATSLTTIEYVLCDLDLLLIMTVNPGFGGQVYLPNMNGKVRAARALLDAAHVDVDIEIDGGVDSGTAPAAIAAGANVLVAGTSVFRHAGGITAAVAALRPARE